jgi:uncharacterized protein
VTLIYLDSSAVIKLFLTEPGSETLEAAVRAPDAHCVTSDLTYSEIHGFLSRALSLGRITLPMQAQLVLDFQIWFDSLAHSAMSFPRIQRAGKLAIMHNLRGADAIHLVTAIECLATSLNDRRVFACFDERLTREAKLTGCFDEFITDPSFG